jgi:hypothetical protein
MIALHTCSPWLKDLQMCRILVISDSTIRILLEIVIFSTFSGRWHWDNCGCNCATKCLKLFGSSATFIWTLDPSYVTWLEGTKVQINVAMHSLQGTASHTPLTSDYPVSVLLQQAAFCGCDFDTVNTESTRSLSVLSQFFAKTQSAGGSASALVNCSGSYWIQNMAQVCFFYLPLSCTTCSWLSG